MKRLLVCLAALAITGAGDLAAQCQTRGDHTECRSGFRTRVVERDWPSFRLSRLEFGVRGGYDFDANVGSGGAQLRVPLVWQVLLVPSADVFIGDDGGGWQFNGDLMVRPSFLSGVYGGMGIAVLNREDDFDPDDPDDPVDGDDDDDTQVGLNLFLGLESGRIRSTSIRPFAEGRWTGVDDDFPFRLVLGFNVPVSVGR